MQPAFAGSTDFGNETPVCTVSGWQVMPRIDGDLIVWDDYRNGNWDVYLYDLSTGTERQVTTNSANQTSPAVSGNRIVWEDDRNGNLDIYMYDRSTGTEVRITDETASQWHPVIDGNRIVWYDVRGADLDLYLYDIASATETRISCSPVTEWWPAISGDIILWEDDRNGNGDIYLYEIGAQTQRRITTNTARQAYPALSGDIILWEDERGGDSDADIYQYDLETGTETRLTTNPASQVSPAIDGDLVAWEDRRGGNWDICLYNRVTGTEEMITDEPANQWFPSVSENRVVWEDRRRGEGDIYLFTVGGGSGLTASFSGTPRSGEAPLMVQFTDRSTGDPTAWLWNFGDGSVSTEQNPVHTFAEIGTYTVSLTVGNDLGNSTEQKSGYITVAEFPEAAFDANATSGAAPLAVEFTDHSTGVPVSWSWDFGDGTTSAEQNPVHVYEDAGTYTVTLTAANPAGSDTVEAADSIIVFEPPAAYFTANTTEGVAPFAVRFNDTSTGNPTSWAWDFGDNTTSTEANPVHMYTEAGTYSVSLTVANEIAGDTLTRGDYITVTAPPAAAFDANVTLGASPLIVQFTDRSTGNPEKWRWDFGDGRSSVKQHPVHTYTAVGNYSVSLTVTNDVGSVTEEKADYICVVAPPSANFSVAHATGTVPFSVTFIDTSIGIPTDRLWTFGDGTISTEQNPVHTYVAAGTYTVSLNVTNPAGSDSLTKTDLVSVAPAPTTSVPSSGGGGGGGGGGSSRSFLSDMTPAATPTPTPVPTTDPVTDLSVNASGLVTRSVRISSADNVTLLQLDEGVRATDAAGAPLPKITVSRIAPADLPELPDEVAVLVAGYAYLFGPEGAAFDPAVLLTFAIPEDVWKEYSGNDGRFTVRWYNPGNETWEDLPTDVDEEGRTISARISHFSTYALFRESDAPLSPDMGLAASVENLPAPHSQGLPFMQIATGLFALLVIIGGTYLYVERNRP